MRHVLPILVAVVLAGALAAADIPDGSTAVLGAMPGTGCIKIACGERAYYLPTHEIVGVQAKSNGCSVTIRSDKGTETRDYTISAEDFVELIKLSR